MNQGTFLYLDRYKALHIEGLLAGGPALEGGGVVRATGADSSCSLGAPCCRCGTRCGAGSRREGTVQTRPPLDSLDQRSRPEQI